MVGETDLTRLLKGMRPVLQAEILVFASLSEEEAKHLPAGLRPLGLFREPEGVTVIIPAEEAAALGLTASAPMRQITLTIHSALEAVGLTAAFSGALAAAGISANVVSGYYHDHIFVPAGDAERAMAVLQALAEG